MAITASEIGRYFAAAEAALSNDAQGKVLEDLLAYLFNAIPGCYTERNLINPFGAEQIDVAVGNDASAEGLPGFPAVMLVECKDWSRPVTSAVLSHFVNILADRHVEVGILFAASGITGEATEKTHAHSIGVAAVARGVVILVITKDDLLAVENGTDFINLVKRRRLRAVASGGLGVPS
jgi:hypothetical protein